MVADKRRHLLSKWAKEKERKKEQSPRTLLFKIKNGPIAVFLRFARSVIYSIHLLGSP